MRKTLLIAAAALAASVISSQAQVYSQNIVGYVNLPVPIGYVNVANPLDAAGGNSITNAMPILLSGGLDGSFISIWNGHGFTSYAVDHTLGGIADPSDTFAVTPPIVNPGTAFYIQNTTIASNTVTFVGTVHVDGAGASTNVVGVSTNVLTSNPATAFYASAIPVGGGLGTALGLVPSTALNGDFVNVPIITGGNIHGFTTAQIDTTVGSGWADASDSFAVPEPIVPVATGFFFQNVNGTPFNWVQSF
jgi:hypothetical protein